jgi:hypothetical protein
MRECSDSRSCGRESWTQMGYVHGPLLRIIQPVSGQSSQTKPRKPGARDSREYDERMVTVAKTIVEKAEEMGLELDASLPIMHHLRYDSRYLTESEAMDLLDRNTVRYTESAWLIRQQYLLLQACRCRKTFFS